MLKFHPFFHGFVKQQFIASPNHTTATEEQKDKFITAEYHKLARISVGSRELHGCTLQK
jgi:hypothetical protein